MPSVRGLWCRSWRPREASTHPPGHLPGRCRVCWRPCLSRVGAGQTRCADCSWALAQHPDPRVRLALAAAHGVPPDVLELLATDPDPLVANLAARTANLPGSRSRVDRAAALAGSR